MTKQSYRDLIVILALTIGSIIFLMIPALNDYPVNLIPYILLLLFLPGYALQSASNPQFNQTSAVKRIVYSIIISLIITIFLAILATYTTLYASNYIFTDIIAFFTLFLCILAIIRRMLSSKPVLQKHAVNDVHINPAGSDEDLVMEYEKDSDIVHSEYEKDSNITTSEYEKNRIESPANTKKSLKQQFDEYRTKKEREQLLKNSAKEIDEPVKVDEPIKVDPVKLEEPENEEEFKDETVKFRKEPRKEPVKKEFRKVPRQPGVDELKKEPQRKPVNDVPRGRGSPYLDLLLIIILTGLCVVFIVVPALNSTVFRTVLGLLLVLFLPGYSLISLLFPKKDDLDGIERVALSFGLSIALTPLIGLILNYTPYGIRLDPILVSLAGLTFILSGAALIRRQRLPDEDRFRVEFGAFFNGIGKGFSSESRTGKILSVVLIISILLAVSTTAYIIVKPKEGEKFTEFYILGPGGKASDYPTNLTPGQEGKLIIGVVNHENAKTTYHLVVTSNGTVQDDRTLTLQNGQKLEIPFNFTAGEAGERKMEFFLYKLPDNNNIYRSLHLWLNITGSFNNTTA